MLTQEKIHTSIPQVDGVLLSGRVQFQFPLFHLQPKEESEGACNELIWTSGVSCSLSPRTPSRGCCNLVLGGLLRIDAADSNWHSVSQLTFPRELGNNIFPIISRSYWLLIWLFSDLKK